MSYKEKLATVNEKQLKRLFEVGFNNAKSDTTIDLALQYCRDNVYPYYWVNINKSAYIHATIIKYESGYVSFTTYGTNSWDSAKSLALDYVLGIYEVED